MKSFSCLRSPSCHSQPFSSRGALLGLSVSLLLFGLSACAPAPKDEAAPSEALTKIMESLYYEDAPETTTQGAQNPPPESGVVLAIARTQDGKIPSTEVKKVLQAFLAQASNAPFRVVTIEDLSGSARESLTGAPLTDSVQSTASNQQALQYALSQGIPCLLTVSIESLNVRPAQTAQNLFIGDARGTVSLLSGSDAQRVATAGATANVRGFNQDQVADNTLTKLAAHLAEQITSWVLPETWATNEAHCEIHAQIEGLTMPAFTDQGGKMVFDNQNIPLFASGANVEIDGVLVGQTPCRISTGKGLRKLKVYREGLNPFEAVVNLSGKDRFEIVLTPSAQTRQQFNDQLVLLRNLQQQEKLSAANVNVLDGYAKMLRQSGFRIDKRKIQDGQKLSLDKEDR